jgi:hypothetical protein
MHWLLFELGLQLQGARDNPCLAIALLLHHYNLHIVSSLLPLSVLASIATSAST